PESVLRAARLNIPMALAIIGGDPARFEPFARLYRETLATLGMPELPVSVHSPGHVAETDDQAIEEAWPGYEASFGKIGLERGWGPTSKEHFLSEVYHGSMYVGSPETVAKKIVHALSSVGASRFDLKYDMGPLSHSKLTKSIELYATKVVPMVREMLETV
ncbi:MAG: LLM class flavin-dependent oxidoreductase, partial [Aquiluna sp.]